MVGCKQCKQWRGLLRHVWFWSLMHCCCCCRRLADPERRGAALATIKNGNLTMQGPVMLKQGFRAAVARTPVFISNVSEDEFFGWVGLVGVAAIARVVSAPCCSRHSGCCAVVLGADCGCWSCAHARALLLLSQGA